MQGLSTLHFYDAAAPIVTADSLDTDKIFRMSRYDRGEDYLNCPMTREEYFAFVHALQTAETAEMHGFEEKAVFEGCMPIESMAKRGDMVMAFGPCKPVGLKDPRTDKEPFAVVQLRQDNENGDSVQYCRIPDASDVSRSNGVYFGMIPGIGKRRICPLWRDAPQHLPEQPRFSGRHLPGHLPSRVCPSPDRSPAWRAMWKAQLAGCCAGLSRRLSGAGAGTAALQRTARRSGPWRRYASARLTRAFSP